MPEGERWRTGVVCRLSRAPSRQRGVDGRVTRPSLDLKSGTVVVVVTISSSGIRPPIHLTRARNIFSLSPPPTWPARAHPDSTRLDSGGCVRVSRSGSPDPRSPIDRRRRPVYTHAPTRIPPTATRTRQCTGPLAPAAALPHPRRPSLGPHARRHAREPRLPSRHRRHRRRRGRGSGARTRTHIHKRHVPRVAVGT